MFARVAQKIALIIPLTRVVIVSLNVSLVSLRACEGLPE